MFETSRERPRSISAARYMAAAILLVSCTEQRLDYTQQSTTSRPDAIGSQCHYRGRLPDPFCTPGEIDPRVTQENIYQTICVSGYTRTVRPSSSKMRRMKLESMAEYGVAEKDPGGFEYDHLISLQLGGSPSDERNLWPEPDDAPNPKDAIEGRLHDLVCEGEISLAEAQERIAQNWLTALSGY